MSNNVSKIVSEIISSVRQNGNQAVFEYTNKLDYILLNEDSIRFSKEEIEQGYNDTPKELISALEKAYERVVGYNKRQLPENNIEKDSDGFNTGWNWYPINSVGIYVPGGLASYPSTVIMTAPIAKAAGVKDITITMPCPGGQYNKTVLAACKICGIEKIYKIGGAQAIAALAYGTETINPVDKIVGPGNAFVAEAKRQVYGQVGIDSIAGPSEILIIADNSANPEYIAYDLLSQAEHDPLARSILVTDSEVLKNKVTKRIEEILPTLSRKEITQKSWQDNGIIEVMDLKTDAVEFANKIAPEHMEVITQDNDYFAKHITTAGAIFLGSYATEPVGDYIAGPSHVLPTSGTARFSSGLSVYDFLRRSSIIECNEAAFNNIADATIALAENEGLECHAMACKVRKK